MATMEKLVTAARKLDLSLNPGQLEKFEIYYRELIAWNQRFNLTRITGYEEVQLKHFFDALTITLAWSPPQESPGPRVIDVGTGAGIPGLPLKIVFPDIQLSLLEATKKKTGFLAHLCQALGFSDVDIITGRAENVAHQDGYREYFDLTLARGVAPLASLIELTLPFCRPSGILIASKKGDTAAEIDQAGRAIKLLGGKLRKVKPISLTEFDDSRQLIIIDKVSPSPPLYPRRPGVPLKRPLLNRHPTGDE